MIVDQLVGTSSSQVLIGSCRSSAPASTSDRTTVERTSLLIEQAWNRDRGLHGWLPGRFVSPTDRSSTAWDPRTTSAVPDQSGPGVVVAHTCTVAVTGPS